MTSNINILQNDSNNPQNNLDINNDEKKYSTEYECVTIFKSIFEQNRFPKDFDMWTIKEQYNWIKENVAEFCPNVPKTLLEFIPAAYSEIECDRSQTKLPKWFDMDKYRNGQKFVHKHHSMIMMSKILGLVHAYSFDDALKPIIMAGRAHTPYLGFTRSLSTSKRISSWYDGEPWIKGTFAYKNMQFTRRIHLIMRRKVCQLDNDKIDSISKFADPWCPDREVLLQDFAAACPFEKPGQRPYIVIEKAPNRPKGINNADLTIIQACFIAVPLLRTRDFGLHNVTDKELDAFCHMWRCYGYFLGIKDEYNFCRGSLEEIKQRLRDLYQYWIIPNFKDITPEWEHMTKCMIESMNYLPFVYMPYKAMLLMATDVLDINMPRLYALLSYPEWMAYKGYKFFFNYVLKLSTIREILNKLSRYGLVREITSEQHTKFHKKSIEKLPDFSVVW